MKAWTKEFAASREQEAENILLKPSVKPRFMSKFELGLSEYSPIHRDGSCFSAFDL